MNLSLIILIVIILLCVALVVMYNKLSVKRNQIQNAISSLDALFIKRADLIPNLISIVKQYMHFEKDTLEKITQMRGERNNPNAYKTESEGSGLIKQLMLNVENYPDLKANTQFINLQYSFNECEEQISAGRRFLSASITDYNDQVAVFPSSVVASTFGFKKHQWENATPQQKEAINSAELFKS